MSKKNKPNPDALISELQDSVFFPQRNGDTEVEKAQDHISSEEATAMPQAPHVDTPEISSYQTSDSKQSSNLASKLASTLSPSLETIELIRKVVKNPGKQDVLYVRLTQEEKASLGDITYTYKRQGIRTSDNEIVRIALNTILEDYKVNGASSTLARLLDSLHA